MCKKVGEIHGIPQFILCEEYKEAKRKLDKAIEDLETAEWDKKVAERKLDDIVTKHQRIHFDGFNRVKKSV